MCVSVTDVFWLSGLRRGHRHLEKEHTASEKREVMPCLFRSVSKRRTDEPKVASLAKI